MTTPVTEILKQVVAGEAHAADALLPLVYEQLRAIARQRMSAERPDHTLQATALVHEAYARLVGNDEIAWDSRGHFFIAAAEAMRRILVEHGRARARQKRGGPSADRRRVPLSVVDLAQSENLEEILILDEALCRLSKMSPEMADVVHLRFFAGLSIEETAKALGISTPTVKRRWTWARAWLYREMKDEDSPDDRLDRAAGILDRALELGINERPAYLKEACGRDDSLRDEVEAMLTAHEEAGDFLAAPTHLGPNAIPTAPSEQPGTIIDRYKLLELIGQGGFGAVYMAQQTEPVRRKVALKIIKLGMDTKQVIARFEAERQALAMMDHPNIAKVLDAGATETGRPYFVMELVKGVPITEYCDTENLATKDRLDLMTRVCNAVQHAHQKGVIHRDIKPSNVMVTIADGRPIPKVIDFGIAKATDRALTDKTLFTEFRQLIGTPAYMSPEQAQMSGVDIDTRSDIYSLGVLLYELLTGTTPFDPQRLRSAAFGEMQRIIREEEPDKPSTRVASDLRVRRSSEPHPSDPSRDREGAVASKTARHAGQPFPDGRGCYQDGAHGAASSKSSSIDDLARFRRTDPASLTRHLRGDLDWIVMKCLEKDRTRRYETANGVASDIQRHLENQPVQAGPPTAAYRFRKFARRNKAALITTAAVAASLIIGLTLATVGLVMATHERDLAETSRLAEIEQRERAERLTERAETARLAEAEQHERAEANLGLALEALDKIYLKVAERLPGKKTPISEADRELLQNALTFYERFAEANSATTRARHETARAYIRAGDIHKRLGRYEQAVQAHRQALNLFQALSVEFPDQPLHRYDLALAHRQIANALAEAGRAEEALPEFEQSVAIGGRLVAEFPNEQRYRAELATTHANLGIRLVMLTGRFEEGEQSLQQALALRAKLAAEFPDNVHYQLDLAHSQHELGVLLLQRGRYTEAEPHVRRALEIRRRLLADFPEKVKFHDRFDLSMSHNNLGVILWRTERYEQAEQAHREAIRLREQLAAEFPRIPQYRALLGRGLSNLGLVLNEVGRLEDAEQAHRRALEIHEGLVEESPDLPGYQNDLGAALHNLASVLEARGQFAEAVALYERAIDHQQTALKVNPRHPTYRQFLRNHYDELAWLLATCPDPALRDAPRAVKLAKSALELFPDSVNAWNSLGVARYRTADWKAAIEALEKSSELDQGGSSFDFFFLAMAHWQLDEKERAREWYDRAVAWMQEKEPDDEELQRFRAEAAELLGLEPEASIEDKETPP